MAARYSSIGEKRLVKLAADKKIIGFPDSDDPRLPWIFDLRSIDAYRQSQAAESDADHQRIKQYLQRRK